MGKKGFEYEIRGYRYAPESFRAFKGLPGQKMEQIPLSGAVSYTHLTLPTKLEV